MALVTWRTTRFCKTPLTATARRFRHFAAGAFDNASVHGLVKRNNCSYSLTIRLRTTLHHNIHPWLRRFAFLNTAFAAPCARACYRQPRTLRTTGCLFCSRMPRLYRHRALLRRRAIRPRAARWRCTRCRRCCCFFAAAAAAAALRPLTHCCRAALRHLRAAGAARAAAAPFRRRARATHSPHVFLRTTFLRLLYLLHLPHHSSLPAYLCCAYLIHFFRLP